MKKINLSKKALTYIFSGVGALILLLTDLFTKIGVVNYFKSHTSPIVLIPGFLRINYTLNEAAAFGIGFSNPTVNRVLYCIVALIGIGIIVTILSLKGKKMHIIEIVCCYLIGVGALGNFIDRVFYSSSFLSGAYLTTDRGGLVVDWIDFYGIWQFNFNIADSCIVIGVLILIVYLIVDEVITSRKNKAEKVEVISNKDKVLSKDELERLEEQKNIKEKQ